MELNNKAIKYSQNYTHFRELQNRPMSCVHTPYVYVHTSVLLYIHHTEHQNDVTW